MQSIASPEEATFLRHEPCPSCGSSDALGVYSDGHTFCFSCQKHTSGEPDSDVKVDRTMNTNNLAPHGEYRDLTKRGIREDTCRKFGYSISAYNGKPCHVASYRDANNKVVAQKLRFADKQFKFIGDTKEAKLFGEHLWKAGGRMLVLCEGEVDTLSMSQCQNNNFPVCGVPTGAAGAKRAIQKSLDFVESFDRVIIMMDMDEAGQSAALQIAQLLTPSKAHIAHLPLKDVNEMVLANRSKEVISAMWEAKVYRPDGIVAGTELWDTVSDDTEIPSIPYPYEGLNTKTHGLRRGELVTLTAGSGVGKSQVCREIAYHLINQGESLGYIALEENTKRSALGLMGLALDKPLHLSKDGITEGDLRTAFDLTVGNGKVFLYDHFGSLATDNLLARVRYLAKSCDVGWVILDHLSIVVSGVDDGDERKAIDVIMTKLRSLCEETGIGLILVSHLRRPSGDKGWEEGLQTSLNSLRGSAAIAQLSDMCIGIERNQQGDNPNISTVRILKNRFSGETGVGCYLHYNKDTGRMIEVDDPEVFKDESPDKEDF